MADDISPTLAEVGAIIRHRTRSDTTGDELGTFDASTSPTGAEVQTFVTEAVSDVRLQLPTDIPTDLEPYVKTLVKRRAAMAVELSYGEDDAGEGSTFARLERLYNDGVAALRAALDDRGTDVSTGGRLVVATVASPYSGDDPLDLIA